MFKYAIEKGLNVFMEKPVTVDGPTSKRMFELGKLSVERNLKVGVGLMCRHCIVRGELLERIRGGQIGDVLMLRAYRMAGPTGSAAVTKKPEDMKSELLYQISRFHGFLWASGGAVSDFLIHNIDECCWMKEDWPVRAIASGGRHYRNDCVDQNFDTYSIEYTFADGTKMFVNGRTIPGCRNEFASYAHGTKGSAVISASGHAPAKCKIYKGQNMTRNNIDWQGPANEPNPYQLEWNDLINAIRKDMPYNEVERGVKASLVTSMGRMAAHTGVEISYDDMLNCEHEFAPGLDMMTYESPAPVRANAEGVYPIPQPGILTTREYGDS
jgi:predicted dehydrogenase